MRDAKLSRDLLVTVAAAVCQEDLAGAAADPIQPLRDLREALLRDQDPVGARSLIAPDGIVIQRWEHIRIHGHESLAAILVDRQIHHDRGQQPCFIVDRVAAPILKESDICVLHEIFGILGRSACSCTDPHEPRVPGRRQSVATGRPMSWPASLEIRPSLRGVQFHGHRHCLVRVPSGGRRDSSRGGTLLSRSPSHSLNPCFDRPQRVPVLSRDFLGRLS